MLRARRSSDECQSQCIHNGRYCTPDPDGDLQAGYSGKDIVQVGDVAFARPNLFPHAVTCESSGKAPVMGVCMLQYPFISVFGGWWSEQ